MTWLDVGNGWRNLFLLSCALQALALGVLFALRGWFSKRSKAACFLTGAAVTPLAQYLWMLLLAFLWPKAPVSIYIGVPPALAAAGLVWMLLRRVRRLPALLRQGAAFLRRVCRMDKPTLISLCFALCMAILVLPSCVRFCSSMNAIQGGDAGEYMALAERYCEDRSVGNLLEKEETVGHFRGHSHFPSLELYMSYGLFHTGGAEYGYPFDKAAFTGVGMLTFYVIAAYLALLLVFCDERKPWVLLGALLLNLTPNLYDSIAAAPRDLWRILALFIAILAFGGLRPTGGGVWRYLGKLLFSFALCFTVMSAHVVCFVVLPFVVLSWVLWRWGEALWRRNRTAVRTLLSAAGVALAGAGGVLTAYAGNLWCFRKWGEMSPWRLMTTYTDAPWYAMYMDMEYKLDETTTHLNFFQAKDDILLSYATPLGIWGFRLALVAFLGVVAWLICRRLRLKKQEQALTLESNALHDGPTAVFLAAKDDAASRLASRLLFCALLTLTTMAAMAGFLDSPLYSFSGSFAKVPRYTLQWFMLAGVMICAALSALPALWPRLLSVFESRHGQWLKRRDASGAWRKACLALPAALCALLCAAAFIKGVSQTGYTASYYRDSRSVMESESILLDKGYRERYGLLTAVADAMPPDEKLLITRVGYQYALKGKGYCLLSNPIVPILNMRADEIAGELKRLNAGMLATEPGFWDERYFPLTTLHQYLQTLPPAQVIETETMRLYLLDEKLVPVAQEALKAAEQD